VRSGSAAVLAAHAEWFAASDPWSFDYEIVVLREFAGAGLALLDVTYRERQDAFSIGGNSRSTFAFSTSSSLFR
jgi:hypothetical protein